MMKLNPDKSETKYSAEKHELTEDGKRKGEEKRYRKRERAWERDLWTKGVASEFPVSGWQHSQKTRDWKFPEAAPLYLLRRLLQACQALRPIEASHFAPSRGRLQEEVAAPCFGLFLPTRAPSVSRTDNPVNSAMNLNEHAPSPSRHIRFPFPPPSPIASNPFSWTPAAFEEGGHPFCRYVVWHAFCSRLPPKRSILFKSRGNISLPPPHQHQALRKTLVAATRFCWWDGLIEGRRIWLTKPRDRRWLTRHQWSTCKLSECLAKEVGVLGWNWGMKGDEATTSTNVLKPNISVKCQPLTLRTDVCSLVQFVNNGLTIGLNGFQ